MEKGKLLNEIQNGNTDHLCQLIKSSCAILANHKSQDGFEYASIAVATISCAARHGAFTHPDQPDICRFNYTVSRESAEEQENNVDWVTLLHSTANVKDAFGMLVEFKHIPDDKVNSFCAGRGKANDDIQQIKNKYYGLSMRNCVECIYIIISIGKGVVHATSQLYTRDSTDSEWTETDSLV